MSLHYIILVLKEFKLIHNFKIKLQFSKFTNNHLKRKDGKPIIQYK